MMRRAAPVLALLLAMTAGCGGTLREEAGGGAADFGRAKAAYDRGDWVEASLDFKAYVEQYPGTDRTDDALFYLGMSYFKSKDDALASAQFDRLTRDFPQSPFAPDAMFYLARCDDILSRPALLDQTETLRAIDRFKQFLELYPESPNAPEAKKRLATLVDRLAEKRFRAGRLYAKLSHRPAAEVCLGEVLKEYPQSRWSGDAAVLLAELLLKDGKREEAIAVLRQVPPEATSAAKERAREQLRSLGVAQAP